jgi:hypothetical protein
MLNFKEALKEIFEVEMASTKKLYGICDGVLTSSVAPLPNNYNKFITLGNFVAGDVRVGDLRRKFREVELDIECCGVVRKSGSSPEEDAEGYAYALAKKVRTILKGNKKLVSASYSSGLAITSEPLDEALHYVIYDEVPVAMCSITYYIKLVEED